MDILKKSQSQNLSTPFANYLLCISIFGKYSHKFKTKNTRFSDLFLDVLLIAGLGKKKEQWETKQYCVL